MRVLIDFEVKKFFNRKKNKKLILLFLLLSTVLIMIHCNLENEYIKSEKNSIASEIKSVEEAIKESEQMQKQFPDSKDPQSDIDLYTKQLNLLKDKQNALLSNDNVMYLKSEIKLDEDLVNNIQSNKVIHPSESIKDIEDRININKYLLKKNIKPIFTSASMKGFNFITLFFNSPFAVIIMILIITLCADITSSEFESGTYKLLFTQPISTIKVFLSKVISSSIISAILVLIITSTYFCILGIFKGFGSSQYPVSFYNGSVQELIPVSKFIIHILLMQILITVFLCIFSVVISTVFKNTSTSISISIIISVSLYMLANSGLLVKLAFLNPFTYVNCNDILQGVYAGRYNVSNVNYYNGIILLVSVSILLFIFGVLYSRKKICIYKNKK